MEVQEGPQMSDGDVKDVTDIQSSKHTQDCIVNLLVFKLEYVPGSYGICQCEAQMYAAEQAFLKDSSPIITNL